MRRLATISLTAVLIAGCSPPPAEKPTATHLSAAGVSAFFMQHRGRPALVVYYAGDFASSSSHDFNTQDKTFNFSGTITCTDGPKLEYSFTSEDRRQIKLDNAAFDLDKGGVFHLQKNGTVRQLPFEPMAPSATRLELMKEYFEQESAARAAPPADGAEKKDPKAEF